MRKSMCVRERKRERERERETLRRRESTGEGNVEDMEKYQKDSEFDLMEFSLVTCSKISLMRDFCQTIDVQIDLPFLSIYKMSLLAKFTNK